MFDLNAELDKNSSRHLQDNEKEILDWVKNQWCEKLNSPEEEFDRFIIPFIKVGLGAEQISTLLDKIPGDWEFDHREMYYDFRLARWIRHIEPKDLNATVKEYLVNAGSLEEGVLHVQKVLAELSKRMGASDEWREESGEKRDG